MGRCTYSSGISIINNYVNSIDNIIYLIEKNYHDMDLENNTVQNSIEEIIINMVEECKNLNNKIDEINLK